MEEFVVLCNQEAAQSSVAMSEGSILFNQSYGQSRNGTGGPNHAKVRLFAAA